MTHLLRLARALNKLSLRKEAQKIYELENDPVKESDLLNRPDDERFSQYSADTTLQLSWLPAIFNEDLRFISGPGPELIDDSRLLGGTDRSALDYFIDDNWEWISDMSDDHGVSSPSSLTYIDSGSYGSVWQMPDGELLKITSPNAVGKDQEGAIEQKLLLQHSGSEAASGMIRILATYPIYARWSWDPATPEKTFIAIIMSKVTPAESEPSFQARYRRIEFLLKAAIDKYVQDYFKDPEYSIDPETIVSEKAMMEGIPWNESTRANFEDGLYNTLKKVSRDGTPMSREIQKINKESLELRDDWWDRHIRFIAQHISRDQTDLHSGNIGVDNKGDLVFFDS